MASTNTEHGEPGHEGRRENALKKMYFEDWFKVWLVVGFIWAGIKAAPQD